ncbi:MAG: response regulator [Planctomycetes bacterium]|nr:response regulator [Planctomycetota bacterium]
MPETNQTRIPTIVYVEDNAGDATLLEEALRERKYASQLMIFATGEKALRYLSVRGTAEDLPPPHCILLDAHLPIMTGSQLLRYIRSTKIYDDTPVYIFAAEAEYQDILQAGIVSKESFLTKGNSWDGFLKLADLLMQSATAKQDNRIANTTDSKPEVHAEGSLRRQETQVQRDRTQQGHSHEAATGQRTRQQLP